MKEYSDIFATKVSELTCSPLIKHHIDTGDAPPQQSGPFRGNPLRNKEIYDFVLELLAGDLIEPSNSPWKAGVLLVPKKDGNKRLVVDFRLLNRVTKRDCHPLPHPHDVYDKMAGKKFKSSVDLFSGYWQLALDDSSKEKASFVIADPASQWQFKRLVMGLSNSAPCFQRLLTQVLQPAIGKSVFLYQDDVLIYSETEEEHIQHIREVFELLRKANLKMKLKKCEFFKESINYLGHIISNEGVKPDPAKVEKIVNLPRPRNTKEVRALVGCASYYRRLIKDFGKIVEPLTRKFKKDVRFTWNEEDEAAFTAIKQALTSDPVLLFPRYDLPFILAVDGSKQGLGACLSQIQNGREGPVAYASRQLKDTEKRWSVTEIEAAAVIFGLKQFRHYFQNQVEPIRIKSDHRPLVWLEKQKDDYGKLGRWAALLGDVNYKIEYTPGKENTVADCLSRLIPGTEPENDTENSSNQPRETIALITGEVDSEMAKHQAEDELCTKIKKYIDDSELSLEDTLRMPIWAKESNLFVLREGLLYREAKHPGRNHGHLQLVLPEKLRKRVLDTIHGSIIGGHYGYRRTFLKAYARFYWPDMRRDCKDYCQACPACQENRAPKGKPFLKHLEMPTRPNVALSCDVFGPVRPASYNDNKYVVILVDQFSKYMKLRATKDAQAKTVARMIVEEHVFNDGVFPILVSDRGSAYTSNLFKEMCSLLGIKQSLTSAYHPQSDTHSERGLKTMKGVLKKLLRGHQHASWEEMLGPCKMSYNQSIHSSTLQSPYYLEHGRDMGSFLDTALQLGSDEFANMDDYVGQLAERLRFAYHKTREAMFKAREQQRRQYDKRAASCDYRIGDRVLLDKRVVEQGESKKFVTKYTGPWRIIRLYPGSNTCDIADNSYKPKRVNFCRIKPIFESQLWRDEEYDKFDPTEQIVRHFHNHIATQTEESVAKRAIETIPSGAVALEATGWITIDDSTIIRKAIPRDISKKVKLTLKTTTRKPGRPKRTGQRATKKPTVVTNRRKGRPKGSKTKWLEAPTAPAAPITPPIQQAPPPERRSGLRPRAALKVPTKIAEHSKTTRQTAATLRPKPIRNAQTPQREPINTEKQ